MGPDFHLAQLERHCRVCAKVFTTKEYKYKCTKAHSLLLEAFGVVASKDEVGTHPSSFCNTCYAKAKKYTVGGKHVLSAVTVHEWSPHTATDCSACDLFANQLRGGRPKKGRKNRGRLDNSSSQILADISERAPPSWRASQPLVLSRFLPPAFPCETFSALSASVLWTSQLRCPVTSWCAVSALLAPYGGSNRQPCSVHAVTPHTTSPPRPHLFHQHRRLY